MPPKPIKILLVEDNPINAAMFEAIAAKVPGLDITTVDNRAAINGEVRECDVMVLDLMLPDSDKATSMMTIEKYADEIPIVVYSVVDSTEHMERAASAGAKGWIGKKDLTVERLTHTMHFVRGMGFRERRIKNAGRSKRESMLQRAMNIGRHKKGTNEACLRPA